MQIGRMCATITIKSWTVTRVVHVSGEIFPTRLMNPTAVLRHRFSPAVLVLSSAPGRARKTFVDRADDVDTAVMAEPRETTSAAMTIKYIIINRAACSIILCRLHGCAGNPWIGDVRGLPRGQGSRREQTRRLTPKRSFFHVAQRWVSPHNNIGGRAESIHRNQLSNF